MAPFRDVCSPGSGSLAHAGDGRAQDEPARMLFARSRSVVAVELLGRGVMTMAKPKTDLGQRCPPPRYTRWDQRGRPVLLSYLKLVDGKRLCLSLETDDPEIAKRHMRLLVPMLLAKRRILPGSGAAEAYGPKGTRRPRLDDVATELRRLKALSEAEYGSEALATAKRWRRPVGIIHHLVGRKPGTSAGTYRTRRMRRRKRGERIPMGDTWQLRCGRGLCFYLNGKVYTARIEVAGRKYTWPLTVGDRAGAVATMSPVREAGARVREATKGWLECELGTDESAAAAARVVTACGLFATALHAVGADRELVDKAQQPPPQVGTISLLPAAASRKSMKQADEKKCVDELVKMIEANPEKAPMTVPELIVWARQFGVTRRRFAWGKGQNCCLDQARKKTGKFNWPATGHPSR
jgi:hypothetical protein